MAFYLRKSLRVGPIRFNLSKSGVGVSAGVPGLRFGTGPRGNYVRMGRGGLPYRTTFPSATAAGRTVRTPAISPREPAQQGIGDQPLREIESSDVSQMRDSSSAELLNELDRKRRSTRFAPIVLALSALLFSVMVFVQVPLWALVLALIIILGGVTAAHLYDEMTKTVVLFYELESDSERDYEALHGAFDVLRSCARLWHVEAEGDVRDWKRSAGATSVVRRKVVALSKRAPRCVKTNIEVPAIPVGRQTLYLFPDRVLVFERNGVGVVSYAELIVDRRSTRFIEHGSPPRDATVVDRTWKYVNKKGGPDRRFKDNKELPIALYEDVHLGSQSGLNELLQFSKTNAAERLEVALQSLARNVPGRRVAGCCSTACWSSRGVAQAIQSRHVISLRS